MLEVQARHTDKGECKPVKMAGEATVLLNMARAASWRRRVLRMGPSEFIRATSKGFPRRSGMDYSHSFRNPVALFVFGLGGGRRGPRVDGWLRAETGSRRARLNVP